MKNPTNHQQLPAAAVKVRQQSEWIQLYQHIEKSAMPRQDGLLIQVNGLLIQLISCHAGEGTSTIAFGLAKTCADILGKSVVVLGGEADELGLHSRHTASQLSELEGVLPIPEQSFFYLSTPALKKGDPRLLGCADVIHRQTCAKAEFDLVLVDAPPLSDSSIGLSIAKHVDGVVLVVEAEKTRWPELVSAKNDLAGAGGNLIGVVFNKRRNHIPAWLARFL